MNLEYFDEALQLISHAGSTLGPEQKIIIESSLTLLQADHKLKSMFFWGRINGIEDDYFIAFGYTIDCLRKRRFFYSVNGYNWFLLPEPNAELKEVSLVCTEMFQGDPTLCIHVTMDPKFTTDENQIIYTTTPDIVNIKEEDRLACIVHFITDETALVPRGALYKQVDKTDIFNPMFRGLTEELALDLCNYQLYREPQLTWNQNLLRRNDYKYPIDCLDTPNDIVPGENAFCVSLENRGRLVLVKSLLWPGMAFFHKLNSRKHGFCYFGNGTKNLDLLFMLDEVK